MIKCTNITLANISIFSPKYLYTYTTKTSSVRTDIHITHYSYFLLSTEIIFIDSKIFDCICCLQSYLACFPLFSHHVVVTFKIQNHSEKCLVHFHCSLVTIIPNISNLFTQQRNLLRISNP